MVDGHCSSPKHINSGVPQGSVLSPTLFQLFINDLLFVTNCPIHSYANDSTFHVSTSFDRRPTLQDLQDSRLEAAEHITSDLAILSDWGRRNMVFFNASKTQSLHLSTRHYGTLWCNGSKLGSHPRGLVRPPGRVEKFGRFFRYPYFPVHLAALCGVTVSALGSQPRGPGFDPRAEWEKHWAVFPIPLCPCSPSSE